MECDRRDAGGPPDLRWIAESFEQRLVIRRVSANDFEARSAKIAPEPRVRQVHGDDRALESIAEPDACRLKGSAADGPVRADWFVHLDSRPTTLVQSDEAKFGRMTAHTGLERRPICVEDRVA